MHAVDADDVTCVWILLDGVAPPGMCTTCTTAAVTCCLQGRLFVTRDQKLASRRDVGGSVYLLTSNEPADQLAELSKHFGIK